MRILLTNDDGVYAEGLQELRRVLESRSDLELMVVAPDRERSASSHAITLHKPLYVHPVQMPGAQAPIWSVNGTPADCTKIGVSALFEQRPDLVISGINRGANLGTDVLYSGTVSAAIEGVILDIPSIAVSVDAYEQPQFRAAAQFIADLISLIQRRGNPGFQLLNINLPALELDQMAGVAITRLSRRRFIDRFVKRVDPRGRTYYWLTGDVAAEQADPETDVGALQLNMISITPLHLNLYDIDLSESLHAWIPELQQHFRTSDPE